MKRLSGMDQAVAAISAEEKAFFSAMDRAHTLGFEGALEAFPSKINVCDHCGYAGYMKTCPGCGMLCEAVLTEKSH